MKRDISEEVRKVTVERLEKVFITANDSIYRYMYIPLIGIFTEAGGIFERRERKGKRRERKT